MVSASVWDAVLGCVCMIFGVAVYMMFEFIVGWGADVWMMFECVLGIEFGMLF